MNAAILNSRQSRTPAGTDKWIEWTADAVSSLASTGATIVTSTGMNTYEFVLWYAGTLGMKQIVVFPESPADTFDNRAKDILENFELDASITEFMPFKGKLTDRDRDVVEIADALYPVSVKPGGNIDRVISESDKSVCDDFRIDYEPPDAATPDYRAEIPWGKFQGWDYLTHWTRTVYDPFPNERRADYYRSVFRSRGRYSHDALGALRNILAENTIFTSNLTIRGGTGVVSFTASDPRESLPIMTWNRARVRMNFEPYGIAIRRDAAVRAGIRPVGYGDKQCFDKLPDAGKPFYQFRGEKWEWKIENEWRHLGNILLSSFDISDIAAVVFSPGDALKLRRMLPRRFANLNIVSIL